MEIISSSSQADYLPVGLFNKFAALTNWFWSDKESNTIKLSIKLINWAEINSELQTVKISQIPRQK